MKVLEKMFFGFKKISKSKLRFIMAFGVPTCLLYIVFCIYPIFSSIYTSFFDWSGFSENMTFIGLQNYFEILKDPGFKKAIVNDFLIILGKEVLILFLTLLFAISLTRLRFSKFETNMYRFLFYLPNVFSVIIIGTLWSFVLDPFNGILTALCKLLKLDALIPIEGWLAAYPLQSITFVASWCGVGLFMILMIAAINSVPSELYEAAQIDGASEWMQLKAITLPAVWGQITFIIITILYQSLGGNFTLVLALTGSGGVGGSSNVMGLFVYQQGLDSTVPRVGYANAAAFLLLLITIVSSMTAYYILTRKNENI